MLIWEANVCEVIVAQSCPTLCDPMDPHSPPGSSDSPGRNTRVGCHSLLQGIFPIQGSNPGLLCCRQILYHRATMYPYKSTINSLSRTPGIWSPLVISVLCLQTEGCVRNQSTWCFMRVSVNTSGIWVESSGICSPSFCMPLMRQLFWSPLSESSAPPGSLVRTFCSIFLDGSNFKY